MTNSVVSSSSAVASDAEARAQVISGAAAFGVSELTRAYYADATAERLKAIASQYSDRTGFPCGVIVLLRSAYEKGFRNVPDLRGKRIGLVDADAALRYVLQHILLRFSLPPEQVDIRQVGGDPFDDLRKGEVDAVARYHEALETGRSDRSLVVVPTGSLAESQMGVVFAKAETLVERRDLVERFVRAYQRGVAEYGLTLLQRSDDADELKPESYGSTLDLVAGEAAVRRELIDRAPLYCDRLGRVNAGDMAAQLLFWQGRDRPRRVDDVLDGSFTEERLEPPSSQGVITID
jgi:NitT/TauT family transport system substrate-binding protein